MNQKDKNLEIRKKAEHLREVLKEQGITTEAELDKALKEALANLAIGIMTEPIKTPAKSA